jgi:hypothetical protein
VDARIDVVLAPDARPVGVKAEPAAADEPSVDDPDADSASGVDLALRELGATQIGEIEH